MPGPIVLRIDNSRTDLCRSLHKIKQRAPGHVAEKGVTDAVFADAYAHTLSQGLATSASGDGTDGGEFAPIGRCRTAIELSLGKLKVDETITTYRMPLNGTV